MTGTKEGMERVKREFKDIVLYAVSDEISEEEMDFGHYREPRLTPNMQPNDQNGVPIYDAKRDLMCRSLAFRAASLL